MSPLLITALMFGSMIFLMAFGVRITYALGIVGIVFALWLWGPAALQLPYTATVALMRSFILSAMIGFLFMGYLLKASGISDDLFDTVYKWAGGLRGGLGAGTIFICALIAAMVGSSGAATLSTGVIALPSMLKRGYDRRLAGGLVMAGGALGFLIPPSVTMIMFAFISGASVGRLFAGGMFPGLALATMYIIYCVTRCFFQPKLGPAIAPEERAPLKEKIIALKNIILPASLIFIVLGFILLGITSITEAAVAGSVGAVVCAAVHRRLTWRMITEAGFNTLRICGMTIWLIIAAVTFSKVYTGLGAPAMIRDVLGSLGIGPWGVLIIMQLSFFILGMFLDDVGILFICMPIYVPIIIDLGFDLTWFGILYIVNMQMAYLTPPYGINLFYLRAVSPPEMTMRDIYYAAIPFVGLQMLGLVICMIFPQIVLFLPDLLFGS